MNPNIKRRAAAALEVLGVYLAGPFAMYELRRMLGVSIVNPLNNLTVHASNADLLTASRQLFVLLLLQYTGYFMLALPLNWWYRRKGAAAYGLTKANCSWAKLLVAGIVTAALCEWPVITASLADLIHPSPTAPWRQAFMDMSWLRWQFWVFSAIASWALIPFLEELFYRGYCQRRLAEDWGDGPAILGAACLFTFTHTQYLKSNAYSIAMIIGLFLSAVGFGTVFAWTRSLTPAVIAHALMDIPMTTMWQAALLAVLIVAAAFTWKRALPVVRQVFSISTFKACVSLGIIGAAYALLASRDEIVLYEIAIGMLLVAIVIELNDRLGRHKIENRN